MRFFRNQIGLLYAAEYSELLGNFLLINLNSSPIGCVQIH
ncbi:hypothetical protein FDUTEX481_08874 [Tolypothrix sp. PCC 7601]|nr:hypothetical protein FDUTEX481_08874 [Tolypothrix sp. PCC 7601]